MISDDVPVIIGTGITGLAISNSLAQARIPHFLVGKPPTRQCKLGESLDITATVDLLDSFGHHAACFYKKSGLKFWMGDKSIHCDFRIRQKRHIAAYFHASRITVPNELLHIDRSRFDPAVFAETIRNPLCRYHDDFVEKVDYDASTDRVRLVQLRQGATIRPAAVFDCSFRGGPVPTAVGLACQELSTPQQVAFAHYSPRDEKVDPEGGDRDWRELTLLVRLEPRHDDIDGVAWCIPLGDKLSMGISVEARHHELSGRQLMLRVEQAFARRGLKFVSEYQGCSEPVSLRHNYFMQERVCGANWLLAGPSACQVWFMSGAGVGVGTAAARFAPRWLRDPRRHGVDYERYVRGLLASHQVMERLRYRSRFDRQDLHRDFDEVIHANVKRTARYCRLRGYRIGNHLAAALHFLARRGVLLKRYCHLERPGLPQVGVDPTVSQAAVSDESVVDSDESRRVLVRRLLEVAGGQRPLGEGERLVAADVRLHMGALRIRGRHRWRDFVRLLRKHCARKRLHFDCEAITLKGELATFEGTWKQEDGRPASQRVQATFLIRDDQVNEIWTKRQNYAPVFGHSFATVWGFWCWALYGFLWARIAAQEQSDGGAAPEPQGPDPSQPADRPSVDSPDPMRVT